jgi:hypothetical protein
MSGVNVYEPSEVLFRRQLAAFLGGIGTDSGTGGLTSIRLLPITTSEKNALTDAAGLLVYDSDLDKLCVNNGVTWETVTST